MPEQRDPDQLDRERPLVDDETRGEADEEFEDVDEGDEDEAEEEDELDAGER